MSDTRTHTPTPDDQGCEAPMSDHLARFMDHLASETHALRTEERFSSSNWGSDVKAEVLTRLRSHDALVEALRFYSVYDDDGDVARAALKEAEDRNG